MNSTITIEDTDEEVIDVDTSQDALTDGFDNTQTTEYSINNSEISFSQTAERTAELTNETDPAKTCLTPKHDVEAASQTKPIFKVIFRDETVSRKFRERVKTVLHELLSSTLDAPNQHEEYTSNSLILEVWDDNAGSINQPIQVASESEDSQDITNDTLFTVDTQPRSKDDFDIPAYGKKYENAFQTDSAEEDTESPDKCIPKIVCFNCSGNHNLRDCQMPRNRENIKKNRKNLNKVGNPRGARYHLDDDQKFGHIIPGQISTSLRSALGLKKNELPKHIYRMRTLGYPPGWLEEARLQHSGLSLFNSEGVPDHEDNQEPGEVFDEGDKDQYDVKKIFDFPGFNVPAPPGTHDDSEQHWTPQLQALHSKETMLSVIKGKKASEGYTRKKLRVSNTASKDNPDTTPSNMEIEELDDTVVECLPLNGGFQPPLPPETQPKSVEPPPLPPPQEPQTADCTTKTISESPKSRDGSPYPPNRTNSPSLTDLENMKKRLLVELEASSSQSNSDALSEAETPKSKERLVSVTSPQNPEASRPCSLESSFTSSRGNVKSIDLGTPILQSSSPYNKLPSSEKFSKNICDVMNFENLPDATGKYEQMTGVLQKVRTTLAKLNQEL